MTHASSIALLDTSLLVVSINSIPRLLDLNNPGSWPNVFREFGVRGYLCESLGKLESLVDRDLSKNKMQATAMVSVQSTTSVPAALLNGRSIDFRLDRNMLSKIEHVQLKIAVTNSTGASVTLAPVYLKFSEMKEVIFSLPLTHLICGLKICSIPAVNLQVELHSRTQV